MIVFCVSFSDVCIEKSCLNGICYPLSSSTYTCKCEPSWSGVSCDICKLTYLKFGLTMHIRPFVVYHKKENLKLSKSGWHSWLRYFKSYFTSPLHSLWCTAKWCYIYSDPCRNIPFISIHYVDCLSWNINTLYAIYNNLCCISAFETMTKTNEKDDVTMQLYVEKMHTAIFVHWPTFALAHWFTFIHAIQEVVTL